MSAKDDFLRQQNELDEEISKIWEHPHFDGIADYELYNKARVKLLWILKESSNTNGGNARDFFLNVKDYSPYWQNTFANIMCVAYGILDGDKDYSEIPPLDKDECRIKDSAGAIVLDEIAIININKSGGGKITLPGKLNREYKRAGVKEFLLKQIEFISPDIIINSHGVYQFFLDQTNGNEIKKIHAEEYAVNNNRLIIWTSHPNRAEPKSYSNNILNIVSLWKN
ncbi:MAG: hypothetical protein LBQ93_01425 [Treponema sp.]|jgi:hypothetical protein|nr:hypothetical protein [Treponema sp.]